MQHLKKMNHFVKWALFIVAIVITVWVAINLLGAGFLSMLSVAEFYPEEGQWYCEELQLMLAFGDSKECYIVVDGEKITCGCGSDPGSRFLSVGSQDEETTRYRLGEEIFGGEFVKLEGNELTIRESKSGQEYTFVRIDTYG